MTVQFIKETSQLNALDRISDILTKLAGVDRGLQLTSVSTLIFIARHQQRAGGVTVGDVSEHFGIPQATASRVVCHWIADHKDGDRPLVESVIDSGNRRRRLLRLTPDGVRFIESLQQTLA